MATVKYRVVKGDTLSGIAQKYNTTVAKLAKINNISNVNLIHVGQLLVISRDDGSDTPEETKKDTSYKVVINNFGLQSNTDRTVFATWTWSKSNTENYRTVWQYYVDGIWFNGSDSETELKESIYNAPENAIHVRFRVIPISKTRTVNKKETHYWTAEWSTYSTYSFSDNPPETPSVPEVTLTDYTLRATLNNLNINATSIEFQVVQVVDGGLKIFKTSNTTIKYASPSDKTGGYATYTCIVAAGSEYKVRCRSVREDMKSDWTDYSSSVNTKPAASSGITKCKANSETSVYLEWGAVANATSYDIEYSTKKEYFDNSSETTTVNSIQYPHYEVTGLESGQEYFFRVRAVNSEGESAWSSIKSVTIGKPPAAPTTWSSTTTGITGDNITLRWIHNSEDGSTQRYAEVELYIGISKQTHTINSVNEEDDEKTMYYVLTTSSYVEGTTIKWRVRTAGVTNEFGDWSVQRIIDIYSPPTLALDVTNSDGSSLQTLTSFPFYISATPGPASQTPIGYHVSITSNETYETIDKTGEVKIVNDGDEVYSKYYDTSEDLTLMLSAGSVDLENNVSYTLTCTVSMDSGLTAEETVVFNVSWTDAEYVPNAEISIDYDTLTASIRPFCEDDSGNPIDGVLLSVYRREFDGSFTEIATDVDNGNNTFVTDPHPSLDYARYRIVAITTDTGAVSYYDIPGYPVGETAIILQWDETWTNFDTNNEDEMAQPPWSGSLLRLPYNIDISNDYSVDSSLIDYIGRSHPVSYYGTQLGETATWNTEIDKQDKNTLYALRRLAIWTGNVYVREPSGSGYWANVGVSFNQKHLELTIPITLNITRVEGGA